MKREWDRNQEGNASARRHGIGLWRRAADVGPFIQANGSTGNGVGIEMPMKRRFH